MKISYLYGMRLADWFRLLIDCGFQISPEYLHRAGVVTLSSMVNSLLGSLEDLLYGRCIKDVEIKSPPLFILGHPRSGTTHLHNLLIMDPRFAAPTLQQVFFPYTFLHTERIFNRVFGPRLPRTRGFDKIRLGMETPHEEELALCSLGSLSIYMSLLLPHRVNHYKMYLSLRELPLEEQQRWKKIYVWYLKKLTFRFHRQLVLKSPPNTAKISTLLELFPDARFVHISRHPYKVYQSYRYFLTYMFRNINFLQKPDMNNLDVSIFRYYTDMYDSFFRDIPLLSTNRFHTLKFENLEKSPLSEMEALYKKLELQGFDAVRPRIASYINSISGYQKNEMPDLTLEEMKKISKAWKRSFEVWGYSY